MFVIDKKTQELVGEAEYLRTAEEGGDRLPGYTEYVNAMLVIFPKEIRGTWSEREERAFWAGYLLSQNVWIEDMCPGCEGDF